jgi:hypothetical protein
MKRSWLHPKLLPFVRHVYSLDTKFTDVRMIRPTCFEFYDQHRGHFQVSYDEKTFYFTYYCREQRFSCSDFSSKVDKFKKFINSMSV